MLLCLFEARGRFMARSLSQRGPTGRSPGGRGTGLGRQNCSCCVWFPFGPRDLDKRAAFIDWGGLREAGGSRSQLLPFCFPKQTFIEHLLCARQHAKCFSCIIRLNSYDRHLTEEETKAQKG